MKTNKRRSLPLILSAIAMMVLAGGCSSKTATNESADPAAAGKPRIALVMKSLANEFFSTMEKGAEKHQAANSDQYELLVNGIKDESDLGRQVALVDEMVAAGVDAIVIAPADSKALVPALRKAQQAGVVVVNIDNRLDAEVLKSENVTIPFVGPDNQAGAKQVGDLLAASLAKGDQVAVLEGKTTAFNGIQRRLGFEAAMKQAGMEIVSSQSADWETNKANTITASMLSEHPQIKAILAANDSMALGAVAAIKSAGKTGEVLVVGFDNIGAVQQLIREEKVLATADQHGDQLAVYGIETALKILKDPAAATEDVQTPVDLVTKETLAQ
ncbi:sugar ABC transporter substrate-binding protein [Rosistilla oblonga]|uniref:D-ribose-binding periplasmic protein n=1 Tax=Rosistilla oblonga TaxID=2527990 RepID=A0A518ITX4_9BACT|nr:sugar ABC transporter substrate-binding protein [Rosistilla oblonga]QDV56542.1 D-ribose-binding periplasmic protein precursor [Rosistilla oblonga]